VPLDRGGEGILDGDERRDSEASTRTRAGFPPGRSCRPSSRTAPGRSGGLARHGAERCTRLRRGGTARYGGTAPSKRRGPGSNCCKVSLRSSMESTPRASLTRSIFSLAPGVEPSTLGLEGDDPLRPRARDVERVQAVAGADVEHHSPLERNPVEEQVEIEPEVPDVVIGPLSRDNREATLGVVVHRGEGYPFPQGRPR
jgi:hypothetical protein